MTLQNTAFKLATDTKPSGVAKRKAMSGMKTKSHLAQFVQTT